MRVRRIKEWFKVKRNEAWEDWKLPISDLVRTFRGVTALFGRAKERVFPAEVNSDLLDNELKDE